MFAWLAAGGCGQAVEAHFKQVRDDYVVRIFGETESSGS